MKRSRQKLKAWHTTVATAAPAMPHPATKISSGASITLSTAPETMPTMA